MAAEDLKTCYTCLHKVTSLTDLLDEDCDNITFMTKLSKFCTIEVIPEAVGICSDCLSQLRISYKFLETLTTSQEAWKDCFSESNIKTEEIVIVNDAEYIPYEMNKNSSKIEEAKNSSCYNHPSDHHDSDSKPRKENDNNFKCANCSRIFLDEEFLFHGCFKDMHNNADKSSDNDRNIEPKKDTNCKKKVLHLCINCRKLFATELELQKHVKDCYEIKKVESTEPNPECRNNVYYNNFKCARCLEVFSYEEFLFHGCFKGTHSEVNKANSREIKKVKNTEPNSQCGNDFDDNNFECAKCLKVFSDEEFLFHGCFKGAHFEVNKSDSCELKKVKNTELNSQCGNKFDHNNFECAKCSKVFSDKEFLFHGCFKGTQKTVDKFNNHDRNIKPKIDTNSEKRVSHSCTICRKLFASKLRLRKHMTDFHESKAVENIELDSQCRKDSNNLESDLNIFKCVKCSKVFSGEEFLLHGCFKSSQRNNNSNNNACDKAKVETKPKKEVTYECMTCKKSFEARFQLHLHLLRAHKGKQYRCDICEKDFKKSLHLKQHLTLHTGKKYFSCEICNKEFRLMCAKQRHMKVHTTPLGERTKKTPFLCNICGRHFPFSNGYQRHMSIHLGIKRHECKVCNRRFRESTHLKVHMRTHTGEKPYMCDICGQAFSLKASLHKHISNIHKNKSEPPNFNFMCRFCGENFSGNVELHTHIGRVHSDENI